MQNKYIILKSPVKIGDYERVASYSGGLTKGEEQLLVTRDLKFFLTDGKGGYLEFKSINSGITFDEVNQKLKDLDNKVSDKISDLDDKNSKDIKTLNDAVDALCLKFLGYVTTKDFDDLKSKVESNTTLATHDNREVLDKFSVDKDDNPLFNGKKIVADFDTSGIEAEIAALDARSVIGSSLDYGLFGLSTSPTIADNSIIPFDKVYSQSNLSISDGKVKLKAGRKYVIRSTLGTNSTGNYTWFTVYNETDNIPLGKPAWSGTVKDTNIPCIASITPVKDIDVSIRVSSAVNNSYSIDSAFAQMVYFEVEEVGRTTVIDPAEDAKKIQFEYGYFKANQSSNLELGNHLELDMIKGNMSASTGSNQEKGLITLHANKKYKFDFSYSNAGNSTNGIIDFNVCDSNGNILEDLPYAYPTTYTGDSQSSPVSTFILEPTIDTVINFKIAANASHWVGAYLVIEEIAQPYYFNYYKDSIASNVLFSGNAASVGDYTLSDDITKYRYLLISWQTGNSASGTTDITQTKTDMIPVDTIAIGDTNNKRLWFDMLNDTTLKSVLLLFFKSSKIMTYGFGTASIPWTNPIVTRIEGIGYTYENPYQDVITTVDEFALTDSAIDTDINSVWNEVGI